jgi:hypothetical protein
MLVSKVVSNGAEPYSATLFSSVTAIRSLADKAKQLLLDRHSTLHPEFFLASVSEQHWKARAVEVTYRNHLVGIVYAKERLFLGRPTGIVYCDIALGLNIVGESVHREPVLNAAVRSLLTSGRARALRVVVPRDGFNLEAVSEIASHVDMAMVSFPVANHSHLALRSSYDDFLNGLGARTRRNFRYYRRRFEANGGRYDGRMPFECFTSAAWHLRGRSAIRAEANAIKRALRMLSAIRDPILVGVQSSSGEWLSIAGGWCERGRATLLLQMNNDQEYHRDSVSQVLRSFLIEDLIAMGIRELVFWAGSSAPLSRYAEHLPATALYLDSRKPVWRMIRMLVSSIAPHLPKRWREFGHWIRPRVDGQS